MQPPDFQSQVRDGRVTMTKAAGGGFKVTALSEEDRKQLARGQPRTQVIFSLNMDTWDTWRRRVRPEDCIMAHRPPAVLPGTAGAPTPPTGKGAVFYLWRCKCVLAFFALSGSTCLAQRVYWMYDGFRCLSKPVSSIVCIAFGAAYCNSLDSGGTLRLSGGWGWEISRAATFKDWTILYVQFADEQDC